MTRPALRGPTKTTLLFVVAALLFLAGLAGTTFGYFDGETDNVGTYSGGWVFSPTLAGTSGGPVGIGQTVTWTTPTTTGVQNYVLRATNMGTTTAACPAATVTYPETVGTLAAPAGSGFATATTSENGQWVCMQVAADWTPQTWYSGAANATANAFRVGLWATAAVKANVPSGGTGTLQNTDTFTVTYNQSVSASGSVTVCAFHVGTGTGVLIVGDQSSCASTSDSYSIGKITGLTISANATFASSAISKPSATQVRVTMANATATPTVSGTGTFVSGGTAVTSASPTVSPCSASNCSVAPTGGF